MTQRLIISDSLTQFLTDYFDEDAEYLITFFKTKKSVSEIALEETMDKRRMLKKLSGMITELIAIIEEMK